MHVLREKHAFSSVNTVGRVRPQVDPDDPNAPLSPLLLMSDDPEHARRRAIVNRAFTPARIAAWEPRIREVAAAHVDRLRDLPDVDLVRDLAALLPVRVISLVLGVPQEDADRFRVWSEEITSAVGNHDADQARLAHVQAAFTGYLSDLLDRWDGTADAGVLSSIAAAERAGELTRLQCVSFVAELLIAGNITTTHHLASSMALLAGHDGLFARLQADPALVPAFVEESLRLESPIQGFFRLATRDAEVGGVPVPAGARVFVLYASANRDPRAWPDAPDLRLDRAGLAAHVAFGRGAHACIGASLARLESRVVLDVLLDRLASVELTVPAAELPYGPSFVNHGPTRLPVRLGFRGLPQQ
ncbi:hypothetical protein BJF78_11815 [Pseudonocardia sp. CNS-139]|nr:hypothetical protein BJF78_11815 [Pseudonocardia sp. CNS-139]